MSIKSKYLTANIPMKTVGPVRITGPVMNGDVMVPLATFETPLWPSTARGARVTTRSGGIRAVIMDDRMTRSILLQAPNAVVANDAITALNAAKPNLDDVIKSTSRFARLLDIHAQLIADLIYLRLELTTGDAAGHNMTTQAAEHVLKWIIKEFPDLKYVSLSANFCTDKKVSAVNGLLGRGKHVVSETTISRKLCLSYLKTTPEKIADLNLKKNLIGSTIAGSIRSANAHFANVLLALYLATGQDAANIIEGSQGIVHTEVRDDDLYFSATLPNIIVGTVGNGKQYDFVQKNLADLGCLEKREPGDNAKRLAVITAGAVLCAELSLLAALTNPGELMTAHTRLERVANHKRP